MKYIVKFSSIFCLFSFLLFNSLKITKANVNEYFHDSSCDKKHIEVFVREGCGFCAKEKEFLKKLQDESICHVVFLDINEYQDLFEKVTNKFHLSKVTPITIAGNEIIIGFSENNADKILVNLDNSKQFFTFQDTLKAENCIDVFGRESHCGNDFSQNAHPLAKVKIPFFGEKDLRNWTLPALSVVLGFVDGFNPCAMWVLVMFLLALVQMGDRVKMFIMAGTFMLAEAVMYAFILTVWLTTWNFVGFDQWITLIVGLVAIGAGCFFLYEGIFSDGTCKVTNVQQRQKISAKIQTLAKSPLNWGFFIGILVLAFSVNIIEFACSIGIPQTFTEILHLSKVSLLKQISLVTIYIFFYMVDDFVVFGIALWSIEKIGLTHKYAKTSNVIGGILMLLLGIILLVAPEILNFS